MAQSDRHIQAFFEQITDAEGDDIIYTTKSEAGGLWMVLSGTLDKTDPDPSVTPRIVAIIRGLHTGKESRLVTDLTDFKQWDFIPVPKVHEVHFALEGSAGNTNVTLDVWHTNLGK